MKQPLICVIGGTGFVGRHLLNRLSRAGYRVRVPTRHPERHRHLRLVPGCELVALDDWSAAALAEPMRGCHALINLAGILNEGRGRTFDETHVTLVERATSAASAVGVGVYIHLSALNADPEGPSDYLRSKGRGEAVARAAAEQGMSVTLLRPSVIFGPGDSLFNRFATLLRLAPGIVPLACADTRFAPIYVGDLVEVVMRTLESPAEHAGTLELCGPRVMSLRDLIGYTAATIGRKVHVVALGERLARLQARVFETLPGQPFTTDNYLSLRIDSLCHEDGFARFGIAATDVDMIVPQYLA